MRETRPGATPTRPLPRSLDPLPEESLPGYLLRLAYRLGQSPARVASLCGLHQQKDRISPDYLLALPAHAATAFAQATRLSAAEVDDLSMRPFAEAYPALRKHRVGSTQATAAFGDTWALSLASRYCPLCLAGDTSPIQRALGGPWKLRWHLPVVFACPTHHRLLGSVCPACGNALNRARHGRVNLIERAGADLLHPHQCRSTPAGTGGHRHRPCGTRLDLNPGAAPTPPAADLERMLDLQRRLDQRLAQPRQAATPGHEPDGSYFLDLATASQLIKLSWPAGAALAPSDAAAALIDDHAAAILAATETKLATTTYARNPGLWSAPGDSAQCAALLLAAEALLRDRDHDPATLREQVQPLARSLFERTPKNLHRSFSSRSDFSPTLARALVRKVHGFHAAGGHEHARLRVPSRDCRFTAEEVPPYLPQTWYDTYFAGFTDRIPHTTDWTPRHLRRAASLKLVEMTAGSSWTQCAETLGLRRGAATRTLAVLRLQLAGTDLWAVFETTVERIAADLDGQPVRVNYARRRRALAHWRMPETDWAALCSDIPKLDRMAAKADPSAGSVLVWAQVTQAEHLRCPVLTTMRHAGQNTTRLVDEVCQLLTPANQRGGRLELRRRLDRYAAHLAGRCDTGTDTKPPR